MTRLTSKPEVLGYAILISKQSAQLVALHGWPSSQCRKLELLSFTTELLPSLAVTLYIGKSY